MFDTYIRKSGPSVLSAKVDVTETRAPTDESVRLLNEMQEKAAKNLMNKIVIEDNDLKGKIFIFQDFGLKQEYVAYIQFTLNGKEYEVRTEIPNYRMSLYDAKFRLREAMRDAILDQLIQKIQIDPQVVL